MWVPSLTGRVLWPRLPGESEEESWQAYVGLVTFITELYLEGPYRRVVERLDCPPPAPRRLPSYQ